MSDSATQPAPEVAGRLPRRIVIVGRNESAWMAAAVLSRFCARLNCRVTIVTAGDPQEEFVGEATQPSLRGLIANLLGDDHDMMRACRATWHLATQYSDWAAPERNFWIPLRDNDSRLLSTTLFHGWLAERIAGRLLRPLHTYALHWGASLAGSAPHGFAGDSSITASGTFAWQLCGQRLAEWLKAKAVSCGVEIVTGLVTHAARNERGGIERLRLDGGQDVPGDLFIDCSGPAATLMRAVLPGIDMHRSIGTSSHRMIRVRMPGQRRIPPFTRLTAVPEGWCWHLSLHGLTEAGLQFDSDLTDDDTAWHGLREFLQQNGLGDADTALRGFAGEKMSQTSTGRTQFRIDNVVAIGSTAGRVDPLISAGRHVAQLGLELLIELFAERDPSLAAVRQYNLQMRQTVDELSEFARLHYLLSRRNDSAFWRKAAEAPVSEALKHRLSLFTASGHCGRLNAESFGEARYQHLLAGCGRLPNRPAVHAQTTPPADIQRALREVLKQNDLQLKDLPLHEELLDWVHSAPGNGQRSA